MSTYLYNFIYVDSIKNITSRIYYNSKLKGFLPVSLSRSIAADNSLTHPRNADGEDRFNELEDVLLPLLLFPLASSRDEEPGLFEEEATFELLLDELLLSRKKIDL